MDQRYAAKPVRSLQTMLRTIAQTVPRQLNVVPDGIYGSQTAEAVQCFQRRWNLPCTGVADEETWNRIVAEFESARVEVCRAVPVQITLNPGQVLGRGSRHHLLYLVQSMLLAISFLAAEIPGPELTGVLDAETERSVLAFQLKAGLRPTGEIDKCTWKALALQFASASDELSRQNR